MPWIITGSGLPRLEMRSGPGCPFPLRFPSGGTDGLVGASRIKWGAGSLDSSSQTPRNDRLGGGIFCGGGWLDIIGRGEVSKLVDEHDLGSCAARRGSSSLPFPTSTFFPLATCDGRTNGRHVVMSGLSDSLMLSRGGIQPVGWQARRGNAPQYLLAPAYPAHTFGQTGPGDQSAACGNSQRVIGTDHNAPVFPVRRTGSAAPLVAPAHNGVVGCYRAGVKLAHAHALIGTSRSVGLAVLVVPPAGNGVAGGNCAVGPR